MSACRSCGQPIRWAKTEASGALMPLDVEMALGGNILIVDKDGSTPVVRVMPKEQIDPERAAYVSHFATCVNAGKHRRS